VKIIEGMIKHLRRRWKTRVFEKDAPMPRFRERSGREFIVGPEFIGPEFIKYILVEGEGSEEVRYLTFEVL